MFQDFYECPKCKGRDLYLDLATNHLTCKNCNLSGPQEERQKKDENDAPFVANSLSDVF